MQELIHKVIEKYPDLPPLEENWIISPYAPTPTIIEAAQTLYESHSVEDITRHETDKVSADATISCILDVIERSKRNGEKSICFVTGVPGAGKTLVGLDVARQTYQGHDKPMDDEGAVYLSGNDPLVAVLTEALQLSEKAYKPKEKRLTIIMAISTVIAMVFICLVPFNKGDMVRSLIIILLIIGLAFISNTLNIIALAQNKEKYGKKD